MNYKLRIKGFTLIELTVVIGILAVLSAFVIAIVNPAAQLQKARDGQRKSDLSQIQKSLEGYYQDHGRYPSNVSYQILRLDLSAVTRDNPSWIPYMNSVPQDPVSTKTYLYVVSSDGQSYYFYASLDRGANDLQLCHADASKCDNAPADATCGAVSDICNYGVSSPNVSP
ncbi:MAG: type II secretion system protein GspG [Candidatus Levybacteria bacterium]|nr:type II secretion system protein GspG [Candidatus Levybacteria bacterium]